MVQLQTLLALWNQKKVKKEEEEEEEDGGIDLSFLSFFLWSWEPGGLAVACEENNIIIRKIYS